MVAINQAVGYYVSTFIYSFRKPACVFTPVFVLKKATK